MKDHPRRVAVVDDDASMRTSVERLLNAHSFLTDGYPSGEAFLASDGALEAACVVLDIKLNGMSGIELRCRLKEQGSQLPVIFITGIDDEAIRAKAIETGCVQLLPKPFSADSLMRAVEQALAESAPSNQSGSAGVRRE